MFIIVGLVVWGVSIDKSYHWIVGQVALFLCEFYIAVAVYIASDANLTIL